MELRDLLHVNEGTMRAWRTDGLRLSSGEAVKLPFVQTVGQKAKLWYWGPSVREFLAKVAQNNGEQQT